MLFLCLSFFSCNTGEQNQDRVEVSNSSVLNKLEYVAIADGSSNFIFLFDKNLNLGDSTALLLNSNGEILKDFKKRKENNDMIVAGTFYKGKALLLSLNKRKLLLYEVATGNTFYCPVNEVKDNFLQQDQFYLLNDSIALFVTAKDHGGSDFTGKNLIAVNMKSGQKIILAENIGRIYRSDECVYFTKEFNSIYAIDSDAKVKLLIKTSKSVIDLTGNISFSGYLTWDNLDERLNVLWYKNIKSYTDRIFEFSEINDYRYKSDYSFELINNKTNKVVFKEDFPKDGYDIYSVRIVGKTHVLFKLFKRNSPNSKKVMILTVEDKQYHNLPKNRILLGIDENHLIIDGNKLGIYNINTQEINETFSSANVSEVYMNRGCCGFYYYVTPNFGKGFDLYRIDLNSSSVKRIKRLLPIKIFHNP